jgi:hypothetical protein
LDKAKAWMSSGLRAGKISFGRQDENNPSRAKTSLLQISPGTQTDCMCLYYIPDTNIWVDLTQGKISCQDLSGKANAKVVVAPFMIVELMRATVRSGERYFVNDRAMFRCMVNFEILELTKVFIFKRIWNLPGAGISGVRPDTYKVLLETICGATSFQDFTSKTEAPGSLWKRIPEWDSIHEGVLDKELTALKKIAAEASMNSLHRHMARLYMLGGLVPDPDDFEQKFSAAIEYLRACVLKLRAGANLAKNDRGLYVDFQMFFYLADPEAVIVSNEDFSGEITKSPQRTRIISFDEFRTL